ncbi:hypothetical protein WISP_03822 [Willisornis vidua]|uniref:Reverse transcriptase n=1 Tax=Willisornis vidua TaxID=1566151 RepID=A0ABQ9DTJ2_9PASS|nr:hypothetical protein WISP_03822 [Willisornis vidua]
MGETLNVIQWMKTGKAAGVDGISPEIWKHRGQALHAKFHELIVHCREQVELPPDLRDTVIITLYKKKGEKSDCSSYRGESELMSVQQFTYLGSIISLDNKIDKEIDNRLAKAYRAFGKLHIKSGPINT